MLLHLLMIPTLLLHRCILRLRQRVRRVQVGAKHQICAAAGAGAGAVLHPAMPTKAFARAVALVRHRGGMRLTLLLPRQLLLMLMLLL